MKKTSYLLAMGLAVTLLTGCGGKKELSCSMDTNGATAELNLTFEGKKYESSNIKVKMDLSEYTDEQVEAIEKENLCDTLAQSFNFDSASCKQTVENKELVINADYDIVKSFGSEEELKDLTPENSKEELEKAGYTCTIK